MVLKLIYYAQPGLGEPSRIMLAYGKIPFEETTVTAETWPALKPTMPLGQVPVLVLEDGRMLAQSGAIERYIANLAGLYPKDPLVAAFANQASFVLAEIFDALLPTFFMKTVEEKVAARTELLSGKLKEKLLAIVKILEGDGPFLAGKELSFADIQTFALLGMLKVGDMDGIPKTLLHEYPVLNKWYNAVANVPQIKAHYATATGARLTYQPE